MKRGMLRGIGAALIAVAVLSVAACTGKQTGAAKDSITVISPAGQPASLDPTLTNDVASAVVMKQVHETLINQDIDTLAPLPGLAERYVFENDASGEPTRLRLFLKHGVQFHNGEELKASDVKFTIERAAAAPRISYISGGIGSVDVVNDYEVVINLAFPFIPIINNLAHTALSIVNEKAVIEGGDRYPQNPVGTGPYQFVNWVAGDRIELTRWDGYHGESAKVKDITIRYISDSATALLELETGGADILFPVMPHDVKRIKADKNLTIVNAPGLRLNYIGLNNSRPHLNNVKVRQAIFHAIDRNAMVNTVYQGIGRPGRGPLAGAVWGSAAEILEQYEYNPERSRQLLAEAGYPNGFSLTIFTPEAANSRDTAEIMQNFLSQVGITAEIQVLETATYIETTIKGEHDIGMHGWVTSTGDPDYGLNILHSRAHGSAGNRTFYSNPEVDRLLDAGRMETNSARREQIYHDAQKIIHSEAPWVYVQEDEVTVGIRSNVRGFKASSNEVHPLASVYFE